mmetsp:Transcript_62363/g.161819  ORF Transcript_62363/g.161819 Transcript_62363/m.161819 type:complete len:286 (+) Transcript_62363:336-1193(+)
MLGWLLLLLLHRRWRRLAKRSHRRRADRGDGTSTSRWLAARRRWHHMRGLLPCGRSSTSNGDATRRGRYDLPLGVSCKVAGWQAAATGSPRHLHGSTLGDDRWRLPRRNAGATSDWWRRGCKWPQIWDWRLAEGGHDLRRTARGTRWEHDLALARWWTYDPGGRDAAYQRDTAESTSLGHQSRYCGGKASRSCRDTSWHGQRWHLEVPHRGWGAATLNESSRSRVKQRKHGLGLGCLTCTSCCISCSSGNASGICHGNCCCSSCRYSLRISTAALGPAGSAIAAS